MKGLEPGVCRAFVLDNAGRLAPLVRQLDATLPQPVPGYRAKILDGNHLAGTEHRVPATRTTRAAALPGQSLVVLDPATMLVIDVVPCEDAHAQERSLIDQVLPGVEPGDLWIADRNFCTTRLVFGSRARGGSFLVRQHKSTLYWKETTPWAEVGRVATGMVSEQTVTVTEADGSGAMTLRRIRLDLDQPTRDKEKELFLLTDVPRERADARTLAEAYRKRWRLENVFQTLTEALVCEINTLAYPKAALFGFCVALVADNVLATVRAALRSEHGRETVEATGVELPPGERGGHDVRRDEDRVAALGVGAAGPAEPGRVGRIPAGSGEPGVAGEVPPDGARPEEAAAEADERSDQRPRLHCQALA